MIGVIFYTKNKGEREDKFVIWQIWYRWTRIHQLSLGIHHCTQHQTADMLQFGTRIIPAGTTSILRGTRPIRSSSASQDIISIASPWLLTGIQLLISIRVRETHYHVYYITITFGTLRRLHQIDIALTIIHFWRWLSITSWLNSLTL